MSTSILVILAIVVLLFVVIISIYNGIISRENAVKRAWADVITQERQKNKTLPHIEQIASQHQEFEQQVQSNIAALRSAMGKLDSTTPDTAALAAVEQQSKQLIQGMHIAVEAYPDLKTSSLFNNLMREISEQQDNVGAAIRLFNQNVEDFNNGISVFPNVLVNAWFLRKQAVDTFRDNDAEAGFDYRPNI
ncbi:LemA family protein [Bowmanella sp. JS7-9]|uniref:LemA family protein n=1 Tax=Pseudobowmanella zhangzhouensis TaxID=1537679 RepID=A0ABW1XNK2_9ALTE|nr:LemA family protein [Bowmanella sp. JS7-9]TBX24399.1 membrane protein [Bowmanella sp. JS7-9]